MKLLIDENTGSDEIVARLKAKGHEPVTAADARLLSAKDPRVLAWAIEHRLPVLTRDYDDFTALHDLIEAAGGHHWGILVVRFDGDPSNDLKPRASVAAIGTLEAAAVPIAGQIHILNHWR